MPSKSKLGVYRLSEEVVLPTFATESSAAFDLRAFLDGSPVEAFNEHNELELIEVHVDNKLPLFPGWRYKIPTGLIFDIPEGYWLSVNMRGGTAWKKGLSLANDTGIVDEDYVQETFVLVHNTTKTLVLIENGERIAQAKLERTVATDLEDLALPPEQKTSRAGGFNSTGTK